MKKLICLLLAALMVLALAGCGAENADGQNDKAQDAGQQPDASSQPDASGQPASPKPADTEKPEPSQQPEKPAASPEAPDRGEWTREGYFSDPEGNMLSVTWMDDVDEPGWYVGCMIGETSAGYVLEEADGALHGDLNAQFPEDGPFVVTVSEEGEDGLMMEVENGETYHFTPMDMPEASMAVTVSTEGSGNIDYEKGEEPPEIDYEYPYQYAVITLAEPETYTFAAWPDTGSVFIKWVKNGEDFSTEPQITVLLEEDAEFVAVFEEDENWSNPGQDFVGTYQYGRASATVETIDPDTVVVNIDWANSAWETAHWLIMGSIDPDTLTVEYSGYGKAEITYSEDGEAADETQVYDDGTGTLTFNSDGTFTWHEDGAERESDPVFERVPAAE